MDVKASIKLGSAILGGNDKCDIEGSSAPGLPRAWDGESFAKEWEENLRKESHMDGDSFHMNLISLVIYLCQVDTILTLL